MRRRQHDAPKVVRSTNDVGKGEIANVPGNYYNKHEASNPVVRFMMNRFHEAILRDIRRTRASSILDVGAGEGYTTRVIAEATRTAVTGVELEPAVVAKARTLHPGLTFLSASIYRLPFPDGAFDLVVATEVLEHLDTPSDALRELRRITREWCLVSVPYEPWWRIANMARGAYWPDLGNTPGHVQHWNKTGIRRLLETAFSQVEIHTTSVWNVALCRR